MRTPHGDRSTRRRATALHQRLRVSDRPLRPDGSASVATMMQVSGSPKELMG